MNIKEISNKYQLIISKLENNHIINALEQLNDLIIATRNGLLIDRFELQKETYKNILKHSFSDVKDPEKEKIYNHLVVSLFELADIAKEALYTTSFAVEFYGKKKIFEERPDKRQEIPDNINILLKGEDLSSMFENQMASHVPDIKHVINEYFYLIWLTDRLNDEEFELLQRFFASGSVAWYDKCLIVSAITLSIQRCFDVRKLFFLFDLYKAFENQIWQRALTGIVLILYQYDKRLHVYPEIFEKISELRKNKDIEKHIEMILTQLIRSKETEKINKKLKDEIIPEVEKIRPKLNDKLELDNILSDNLTEEKNPDWETVFQDTPDLLKKLEEISRMQIEGSDVFMSAFSMLKNFPFFNEISNWFVPFYNENETAKNALKTEEEYVDVSNFVNSLANSAFMCNSDKYSFCFNVQMVPQQQKSQITELFKMELQGMEELSKEDELINQQTKDKTVITQYLQDMYRFYMLYKNKRFFYNIFHTPVDVYNTSFFPLFVKDKNVKRNLGEFYFEKEFYEDAIKNFEQLNKGEDTSTELFEKIAFAYQRMKEYQKALDVYEKLEIADQEKAWTLKNIALCYRRLKNPGKAIEYYKKAEQYDPGNLYIQTYLGHSYLDLKNHEEALKYYFKIEYMAPSNNRIMRPIAWCSFVLGKFDTASKYYNKLLDKPERNKYDYINNGHVEWCKGNNGQAIENYLLSIGQKNNTFEEFTKDYLGDKQYLLKHGIEELDIYLMLDNLKLKSNQTNI